MRNLFAVLAVLGMLLSIQAQAGEEKKKKKIKIVNIFGGPGAEQERGFLGVHLVRLTKELRIHFGAPKDAGVLVAKVVKDSPADKAGLKVGDVLVEVEGQKVKSTWKVQRIIGKKKKGEKSALKIVRDKRERRLSASIELRKRPQVEVSRFLKWSSPEGGEILNSNLISTSSTRPCRDSTWALSIRTCPLRCSSSTRSRATSRSA
jgi:membrane-associated protease RseP (regulator of RpoE activity)